jgi:RNA polymerase sigma-70 factor, ECF subfamily
MMTQGVHPTQGENEPARDLEIVASQGDDEEGQLVGRASAGDRAAFAALYRTYLPTVYKFLYYRLGGNKALTEDLTAEVFLRALRKIGDFQWTGANFGAWLLRIARNLVLDHAKSSRARLEVLNDEMPENAAGEQRSTESAVLEALSGEAVARAIKQLGADQRDVITMRFLQGMAVGEVAAIMGKKEGTVRTLQFRGLKALQKILLREGTIDRADSADVDLRDGSKSDGTVAAAGRFAIAEAQR